MSHRDKHLLEAGILGYSDCASQRKTGAGGPGPSAAEKLPGRYYGELPGVEFGSAYYNMKSGSSGGNANSSEGCVSRYGLQDYVGNVRSVVSDLFYCSSWGCSSAFADSAGTTPMTTSYLFNIDQSSDWRDADGEYYEFKAANSMGGAVPNRGACSGTGCIMCNNPSYPKPYFNPVMGVPMACEGTSCSFASGGDDNKLSHLTYTSNSLGISCHQTETDPTANDHFIIAKPSDALADPYPYVVMQVGMKDLSGGSYASAAYFTGRYYAFFRPANNASVQTDSEGPWHANARRNARCMAKIPHQNGY